MGGAVVTILVVMMAAAIVVSSCVSLDCSHMTPAQLCQYLLCPIIMHGVPRASWELNFFLTLCMHCPKHHELSSIIRSSSGHTRRILLQSGPQGYPRKEVMEKGSKSRALVNSIPVMMQLCGAGVPEETPVLFSAGLSQPCIDCPVTCLIYVCMHCGYMQLVQFTTRHNSLWAAGMHAFK